jgi:hypothetical protein
LAGQSAANGVIGEVHELIRHEPLDRPKLIATRPTMAIVDLDETEPE